MWLSILIFILSIIPSALIIAWMFKRHGKEDLTYKRTAKGALWRGLLSVLPILLVSATLYVVNVVLKLTIFKGIPVLAYQAVYKFVVLAFAEEIIKYLMLRLTLKKSNGYSWSDVVAFMVIIGTAFGLMEDIPYAVGADVPTMLVRGFTMGHVGYAFMMGWFYGKSVKTGKKRYDVIAVLLPWALHGIYDYSLTPELMDINENFMFIAVGMAVLDVVVLALMIRFFVRERKHPQEKYLLSLVPAVADGDSLPSAEQTTIEPASDSLARSDAEPQSSPDESAETTDEH